MYANDGAAFPASAEAATKTWRGYPQGESPWTWENGAPIPELSLATEAGRERRRIIRDALRASLALPHDGIGNNGGSTGFLQQLSQDYVGARFPGKTWGWGSLADTMSADRSVRVFLDRLRVTTNREYRGGDYDPIAADVLRVQQPLLSEQSQNYGQTAVDAARAVVDNWHPNYFQD